MMDGALLKYELGVIDSNVLDSFEDELYMLTHDLKFSRRNWKIQSRGFSPQMQSHVAEVIQKNTDERI